LLRRQAQHTESTPLAALVFACLGRPGALMASRWRVTLLPCSSFPALPIAGASANGEIGPRGRHATYLHGYKQPPAGAFLVPTPAGPGGGGEVSGWWRQHVIRSAASPAPADPCPPATGPLQPSAANPFTSNIGSGQGTLPAALLPSSRLDTSSESKSGRRPSLTPAERDAKHLGARQCCFPVAATPM